MHGDRCKTGHILTSRQGDFFVFEGLKVLMQDFSYRIFPPRVYGTIYGFFRLKYPSVSPQQKKIKNLML